MSSTSNNDASANRSQVITVLVPLNTTIVGGLVTRRELRIPSELIFADFFSRVCANMDLQPEDASIGYKYHNDRAKDPPRQLSDESEYTAMMAETVRKVLAARSRNPVLFLHNLVRYQLPAVFVNSNNVLVPHDSDQQPTHLHRNANARMTLGTKTLDHEHRQPLILLASSGNYGLGSPAAYTGTVLAVLTRQPRTTKS